MRKDGATLRNILILGGTIIGLIVVTVIIANYLI